MTRSDIHDWLEQGVIPDSGAPELLETHISWVVLTQHFAWKIKKPLHLSFLDFSSLELRKRYCEQEVALNRRLTDIYLGVVKIRRDAAGRIGIGIAGEVIDYAVQMRRLDAARHMTRLLEQNAVTPAHIDELATVIAAFHRKATLAPGAADPAVLLADFADLRSVGNFLDRHLDAGFSQKINNWIGLAQNTLARFAERIRERAAAGFVRDGHGDLHSGNIFLLEHPVVFDCIEFNEHLRCIDVLSELAFLVMDLDFYQHPELGKLLFDTYLTHFPCVENVGDEVIFQYYLLYRASVRLKVSALRLEEELADAAPAEAETARIRKLALLCERYAKRLAV